MSSPSPEPGDRSHIGVTSPSALAAFVCVGLVAGWAYHYAKRLNSGLDPALTWPAAGVVAFLAAFIAVAAFRTRAARREGVRLPSHRAVNLLVLGKACSRVGAAVAGGYVGFAFGYLRASVNVPASQLVLVALTCLAGIALAAAGLGLERACRIDEPDDGPDGQSA